MSKARKTKSPIFTIVILLIAAVLVLISRFDSADEPQKQTLSVGEGILTVHFLDVGQGDSEFIELPDGRCMLIDASVSEYGSFISEYITECGYSKIDYLVATHPHADHIGGMKTIVESFDIGEIYMPRVASNSKTFENLLTAVSQKGLQINTAKAGKSVYADSELSIELLAPVSDEYENTNNYSAVIKITYGKNSFLFTGDAELLPENEVLENDRAQLASDVLKVGHHGSSTSSSMDFLTAVSPDYAVISCGEDNSYGHPHSEVLARLAKIGASVYRTDKDSTVTITCDGNDGFEVTNGLDN